MKVFQKFLIYSLLILLAIFLCLGMLYYAPDKELANLRAKWSYDNSQFVEIDQMPVHYRINGEGDPLVLLHGTGASLHTWEAWTDSLAKDFKVISLDLPGYGLTGPHPDGQYHLDFYAHFLHDFLEAIDIPQCALAGNSLGGGIAWRYASLFPEKVEQLILLNAIGYPQQKAPPLVFQLAQNKLLRPLLLNFTPKFLFNKSIKEVYYNDTLVKEELVDRYYELYLRAGNRQAFLDRIRSIRTVDTSLIKSIETPSLILWGQHDEWVLVENAYKFKRDLANAQLVIYENAGHLPMEEIPASSMQNVRQFLQTTKTESDFLPAKSEGSPPLE